MDILQAYVFSPASLLIGVASVALLLNGAWPRLYRRKQLDKFDKTVFAANASQSPTVSKEPEVPAGWWGGREEFELERRALFSKSWIYLAHSTQFTKSGAYQSFDIAGFPVFLIRGKDNQIRAFHNVCRHRAYTITRKETGASTVLGCRYHGWSYDTYGRLVKAPQFEDIQGFEKSENSLFEIHARTTDQGYVFVNLNANEPMQLDESDTTALDEFCSIASSQPTSRWIGGQSLGGEFNWKFGANSRNFKKVTSGLEERATQLLTPSLTTRLVEIVTQKDNRAQCSLFPTTFLYSFEKADRWISMTFLPASESNTVLRYDLFASSSKFDANDILMNAVKEQVQAMIKDIEFDYNHISDRPAENTPITHRIVKQLQEHQKQERTSGATVRPAMRQPKGSSLFEQAEQLCKEIDCAGSGSNGNGISSGGLDW